MGFLTPYNNGSWLQCYDPYDILWEANPEICALAYADKEKILSPELMPYIALFRRLQSDEKINLTREMTQRLAIKADVVKQKIVGTTLQNLETLTQNGLTTREQIRADTRKNESNNILTATLAEVEALRYSEMMKYETKLKIAEDYVAGQRYISDNELEAVACEMNAIKDALICTEQIRAGTLARKIDAQLIERTKTMEYNYLAKIAEAETLRARDRLQQNTEITNNYITQRTMILKALVDLEIENARQKCMTDAEAYKTLCSIMHDCAEILKSKADAREIIIVSTLPSGQLTLEIKVK